MTDIKMEKMDALRVLRQPELSPGTSVVMMTASPRWAPPLMQCVQAP